MLVWFGSLLKAGKPVVAYRTISEYSHPGPCHPRSKVRPEGLSYCLSLDLNMLTPKWDTMTVQLHHLPLGMPCFSPALLPGLSCSGMYIAGNITLSLIWVCLVLALLSYLVLAAVVCVSQALNTQPDLGLPCFSPALLSGFNCSGMYITGTVTLSLIWVCLVLALLSYLVLAAVACVSQAT